MIRLTSKRQARRWIDKARTRDIIYRYVVEHQQKNMFSEAFLQQIESEYGNRGKKGLEIVNERRVKQYKDYFVVVGESDEYVVEDDLCTCRDFLFNNAKHGVKCSHMIAVKVAKQKGLVDPVDAWYQDVRPLP